MIVYPLFSFCIYLSILQDMKTPDNSPIPRQSNGEHENTPEDFRNRLLDVQKIIKDYDEANKEEAVRLWDILQKTVEECYAPGGAPRSAGSGDEHPINIAQDQYWKIANPEWVRRLRLDELVLRMKLSNKPEEQFIKEDVFGR